jgi:hypothetical protein
VRLITNASPQLCCVQGRHSCKQIVRKRCCEQGEQRHMLCSVTWRKILVSPRTTP